MPLNIHFVAGLPRSGSTLLAAILRQNPRFHAEMSAPVNDMVATLLRAMSGNELAVVLSEEQRERILRAVVDAYYAGVGDKVIFDTHRAWCAHLPVIVRLFPSARVVCCVRSPAWILDSTERFVQRQPLQLSRMFPMDATTTVYERVAAMLKANYLGGSMNALRQAWFGEHADRLVLIRFHSLTEQPAQTIARLYHWLGEEPFAHDFDRLEYQQPRVDAELGMPGFHTVLPRVESRRRTTILPPDLFSAHDTCFWEMPGQNPRRVTVL